MINIHFNGNEQSTNAQSIVEFLKEAEIETAACAIALNEQFVPRTEYATTSLKNGDQLELLVPMQGG